MHFVLKKLHASDRHFCSQFICRYLIWHKVPKFQILSFVRLQCSFGLGGFFCSRTKKKKVNENRTFLRNRKFVFVPKKTIRLGARRKQILSGEKSRKAK